jgi:ubiquinone/menaquinone biosynthesis C-methylase UbiE
MAGLFTAKGRAMWQKFIDGQYRQPSGLVGRWIGGRMAQQQHPENLWTVNLLDVQPTDHILEVGFGPGIAIREVSRRARYTAGVDFSRAMLAAASKRNAAAVGDGKVDLRLGDAAQLPFDNASFDKAFSIHSIYFWRYPLLVLGEIRRVLKPHGRLVLTVLPKDLWNSDDPDDAGTPDCTPYSGAELKTMLTQIGFTELTIASDPRRDFPSNFSVIACK